MTPDIPASFDLNLGPTDYIRRTVMVPMRDGVRLYTVIVIPKGATRAPILLTRTPYNSAQVTSRSVSPRLTEVLPIGDELFVRDGYIRVYQHVRGKHGSEGSYVTVRPPRGPLNSTGIDHSTDAYDTIEWLIKNVPESNGRVGIIVSSYPGFTSLMALINPHPALKAAVPMSPMVDGWRGDDWLHNGAFRQVNFDFFLEQTSVKGENGSIPTGADDYETFLKAGSAGDFANLYVLDRLPFVQKLFQHPAYDSYWQEQALDRILANTNVTTPTMLVVGQWDQEDSYGAPAVYAALEPKDRANDRVYFVLGPWRHSGANYEGRGLGPLTFPSDTALDFRRDVLKPFLDLHLKGKKPAVPIPPVFAYETGADHWQPLSAWPGACTVGCASKMKSLYLQPDFRLAFEKPLAPKRTFDEYVSDPAKPVPFVPRPIHMSSREMWRPWLVSDQRVFADRTDVLTYVGEPLHAPVHIAGQAMVNLFASTSGSDSDWVVKLIDVYPDATRSIDGKGGYQLPIAMEIFRGRYRESLEHPKAIIPGKVEQYRFGLPNANHRFLPGHRIMVQIQSSWYPLYDRNPQTFVPNIYYAKRGDYYKATQRVFRSVNSPSSVDLPLVSD